MKVMRIYVKQNGKWFNLGKTRVNSILDYINTVFSGIDNLTIDKQENYYFVTLKNDSDNMFEFEEVLDD